MSFIKRHRLPIAALGIIVLIGGFLAFRPDKLFVDDRVDESLSEAFAVTADTTDGAAQTENSVAATSSTTLAPVDESAPPPTVTAPAAPEQIATGEFYGIDHAAVGTAAVYEQDGTYVLRFEDDTDIQNGPDLYVWVLPSADYDGGSPIEYLDLGKLKGNIGGQNYQLPDGFDPSVHRTVLVWCLRFGVPFAAAPIG